MGYVLKELGCGYFDQNGIGHFLEGPRKVACGVGVFCRKKNAAIESDYIPRATHVGHGHSKRSIWHFLRYSCRDFKNLKEPSVTSGAV